MKFLIVFALLIAGAFAVTTKEQFIEFRKACAEENVLTPEQTEDLVNYSFPDEHMPACYVECMFKKLDFYHDGHFVAYNVVQQLITGNKDLNEETLKHDITTCSEEFKDETDKCKMVLNIGKCFVRKDGRIVAFKASLNKGAHE